MPRLGAFEVTTVNSLGKHPKDILFYSKLLSNLWPSLKSLVAKISIYLQEPKQKIEGKNAFVTTNDQSIKYRQIPSEMVISRDTKKSVSLFSK